MKTCDYVDVLWYMYVYMCVCASVGMIVCVYSCRDLQVMHIDWLY